MGGGMRLWVPALRLSCRQPAQCSVVPVDLGIGLFYFLFREKG